mmetsp:Transcript_2518/g.9739  ORF Transcript_2518/g.9739 Transcript_2518/m.9739 type:complete len:201 (+) Transcript_2518:138-740(+)
MSYAESRHLTTARAGPTVRPRAKMRAPSRARPRSRRSASRGRPERCTARRCDPNRCRPRCRSVGPPHSRPRDPRCPQRARRFPSRAAASSASSPLPASDPSSTPGRPRHAEAREGCGGRCGASPWPAGRKTGRRSWRRPPAPAAPWRPPPPRCHPARSGLRGAGRNTPASPLATEGSQPSRPPGRQNAPDHRPPAAPRCR